MSWIQSAFGSRISPVILFIIVVLAVVFFLAALLHLLIRFLLKQRYFPQSHSHGYPEMSTSGAFQRQLQQLFHLHDSGLDQACIDALPVFMYKDIVGLKEPFDCAVCLCEFSEQDKLRLLPICSHAFHIDCIDTWLLSNSTCPLCRAVILSQGFSFENPVFYFGDSKESEDGGSGNPGGFVGVKLSEDDTNNINSSSAAAAVNEKRVFSVRLGKFKNTNGNEESEVGESSNSNLDARRCYSMGSFQYVVADSDQLQVALCPGGGGGSDVRSVSKGRSWGQIGNFPGGVVGDAAGDADCKKINGAKGESFSVSKIWLWSKKALSLNTQTSTSGAVPVPYISVLQLLKCPLPFGEVQQEVMMMMMMMMIRKANSFQEMKFNN
ncbi:RING-H2 finger protein ATL47-like [Andrographis paniculata]|uniref:RING-H2 finger protein ATL47-like n=1 Tax=Andrographis paniculata TaxID=175694 RepID=UPI0021E7D661|nr:RING-H2 finger protein ATL47-like [Andrographis paniculata]